MVLAEGGDNTYVSSAMPQKHNPGLLNSTRRDASTAISLAMGPLLRAHNIPAGMSDAKEVRDNSAMVRSAIGVLQNWKRILGALVISPQRALDELNSDWTASQELADLLMRKYQVPFRIGHHFASEVVSYARAHDIRPLAFPYPEARRIYRESVPETGGKELPMTEAEFRAALDPVAIVNSRATSGGPQPAEMDRMLALARRHIAQQNDWVVARRQRIDQSLARLDADFDKLVKSAGR
jgi:argininosuccinate lyase